MTKKCKYIFILLLILINCSPYNKDINLAHELLNISKEIEIKFMGNNPDVTIYEQKIETISNKIKNQINLNQASDVISVINKLIFNELKIQPMPDSLNIDFDSITRILETRQASCVGLTSLYLIIAEQLDVPIYAVLVPGHVFVRFDNDSVQINIETLRKGIQRSNQFYRDYFKPNSDNNYYLRNLDKKEFIAICLFNLANEYKKRGLLENAAMNYKKANRLFPELKEVIINLEQINHSDNLIFVLPTLIATDITRIKTLLPYLSQKIR